MVRLTPEQRMARRKRRRERRRRFFQNAGKGLVKAGGSLLCAAGVTAQEIIMNPELIKKMRELMTLIATAGSNPAKAGAAAVVFSDIAEMVGTKIAERCIKDENKRRMIIRLIQVLDYSKYVVMAQEVGVVKAVKTMVADTIRRAEERGRAIVSAAGESADDMGRLSRLMMDAAKVGIQLPENFMELPTEEKLASLRGAVVDLRSQGAPSAAPSAPAPAAPADALLGTASAQESL